MLFFMQRNIDNMRISDLTLKDIIRIFVAFIVILILICIVMLFTVSKTIFTIVSSVFGGIVSIGSLILFWGIYSEYTKNRRKMLELSDLRRYTRHNNDKIAEVTTQAYPNYEIPVEQEESKMMRENTKSELSDKFEEIENQTERELSEVENMTGDKRELAKQKAIIIRNELTALKLLTHPSFLTMSRDHHVVQEIKKINKRYEDMMNELEKLMNRNYLLVEDLDE